MVITDQYSEPCNIQLVLVGRPSGDMSAEATGQSCSIPRSDLPQGLTGLTSDAHHLSEGTLPHSRFNRVCTRVDWLHFFAAHARRRSRW